MAGKTALPEEPAIFKLFLGYDPDVRRTLNTLGEV
jgi:hypothetical protein